MEYYCIINNEKQGPYDLFSIIKKIKNGNVTAETLIAEGENGTYNPASTYAEIGELLTHHTQLATDHAELNSTHLDFKTIFADAVDLWSKKVIELTLAAGFILAFSFTISYGLRMIKIIADYAFVTDYAAAVIATVFFGLFFYYVLMIKRSQEVTFREIHEAGKAHFGKLFVFSLIFSSYTLFFALSHFLGLLAMIGMLFVASATIFVPFLVLDNDLSLGQAVKHSVKRSLGSGIDNFGTILALVGLNIIAAILPSLFAPSLYFFGLFISLPITVAAFAYMYDSLFS